MTYTMHLLPFYLFFIFSSTSAGPEAEAVVVFSLAVCLSVGNIVKKAPGQSSWNLESCKLPG